MRRCQSFAGFWIDVEKKKLRRFSPNCGTIPQFTGFVPKDWIVEKVAQKAAHPGARYMFELTYHHSLGNFFQLAIRNSVMQPCAAFHSLWRLCFTGDSSPEQVVYTCCLGRNTHTHIHNFRNGVHTATLIFIAEKYIKCLMDFFVIGPTLSILCSLLTIDPPAGLILWY